MKFLSKPRTKSFSIWLRQNLRKILSCSSHCKMGFGISELNTLVFIIEFFAFWDKTNKIETLVIATHGIIKKSDKPEKSEILKAKAVTDKYFETK